MGGSSLHLGINKTEWDEDRSHHVSDGRSRVVWVEIYCLSRGTYSIHLKISG